MSGRSTVDMQRNSTSHEAGSIPAGRAIMAVIDDGQQKLFTGSALAQLPVDELFTVEQHPRSVRCQVDTLIDWYERNAPLSGQSIAVWARPATIRKFAGGGVRGPFTYRGRHISPLKPKDAGLNHMRQAP